MSRYVLKRLGQAVPVLFGVSVLAFALIRLVPGDTATALMGMGATEEQLERVRAEHGLDRPVVTQYFIWLGRVARGDLGESAFTGQPVAEAILERLPVTAQLAGMAIGLALVTGLPLGIAAAVRRGRSLDYAASVVGLVGISVPGFWLGLILILFLALWAGWLPSGGFVPLTEGPWENLRHMILPAVALGTAVAAVVMRMTRSAMLEVIDENYIEMARAKGVGRWGVVLRHALKNALIPVVTIVGIQAGYLLGGSVVIEEVFRLPGVGRLAFQSIQNRDYALLQGTILFIAAAFVVINLVVDLLYALLNPKIRY